MFTSLIVGVLAGLGFKFAFGPISGALTSKVALDEHEKAIFVFAILMGVAALVAAGLSDNASPFWLMAGGLLGVFGYRLFDFAKQKAADAKATAEDTADAVEDKAENAVESLKDAANDAAGKAEEAMDDFKENVIDKN